MVRAVLTWFVIGVQQHVPVYAVRAFPVQAAVGRFEVAIQVGVAQEVGQQAIIKAAQSLHVRAVADIHAVGGAGALLDDVADGPHFQFFVVEA